MTEDNPFSSTDTVAYSYSQRWVNRDPVAEEGGINLYEVVRNSPLNYVDTFGLDLWLIQFPGFLGHQAVVGTDPNGGWWLEDFHPKDDRKHAFYPGKLDFGP